MTQTLKAGQVTTTSAAIMAGCSYRKLDNWIRLGLFPGIGPVYGSGHWRNVPEDLVPTIQAVSDVSIALGGSMPCSMEILRSVAANPALGVLYLGEGVRIHWTTPLERARRKEQHGQD